MGMFDKYNGITRIDLAEIGIPEGWVEFKNNLTVLESTKIRQLESLVTVETNTDGTHNASTPHISEAIQERLVCTISAWNLENPDGEILPFGDRSQIRSSVQTLPEEVYNFLCLKCKEVGAKSVINDENAAMFSVGSAGSSDGSEDPEHASDAAGDTTT